MRWALLALLGLSSASWASPPPAAGSKYPDFSGQWILQGPYVWDPSKPKELGQQVPYTPEYQKVFEASLADQAEGGTGNDYHVFCVPFGMPRMMGTPFPMEFVVLPERTYLLFEDAMPRRVYTDGRGFPAAMEPAFNGHSIGSWVDRDGDGRFDELRVETRGFKGPRAFEASGMPLHSDNETVIQERFFLDKKNSDVLHDEITVIDHALTRPWTVDKRYRRRRDERWLDDDCEQDNAHVRIGSQGYFLSADGLLMPTKKGQPPPDLRYFKQEK